MEHTTERVIIDNLQLHRSFFASGKTKSLDFRLEQLHKFSQAIEKYENRITEALWTDLHKSPEETYLTEISLVKLEIRNHIRHLRRWAGAKRVPTPLHLLPSTSRIHHEPLGVALILAAWNYPFQLLMNPLIGAISSGCCAMLKASRRTPTIAGVMEEMIRETFDPGHISFAPTGEHVNTELLQQRFDFIFYTGSSAVARVVMRAAAENLTPLLLELGGKSPCIVDAGANLDIAAKRIVWGKMTNAGQTCIAPDYLFVHHSVKKELVKKLIDRIEKTYGPDIRNSPWYPRIVSPAATGRIHKLLVNSRILYGGEVDIAGRYLAPTLIDEVRDGCPAMHEEIFGPILPILTYDHIDEPIDYINSKDKPLAIYYFGNKHTARDVFARTTSGGGCINDTLLQIANHHLPYGGVGFSGFGKYHGQESFLAFSNARSIVSSLTWFDLPVKYVPFRWFKWVKKII